MSSDLLKQAQTAVAAMWDYCSSLSSVKRASPEDTCHFLHEEISEVVKCGMHMGLMGDKSYYRSDDARTQEWTWERMVMEVGDVLLMAITLAEALDLNAGVCLEATIAKFHKRADQAAAAVTNVRYCDPLDLQRYVQGELDKRSLARGIEMDRGQGDELT